ncbi:unnamed protein product [Gadus morhua 'NCC']
MGGRDASWFEEEEEEEEEHNCYAKIITVESQKNIVIYSRQTIGVSEDHLRLQVPQRRREDPLPVGADG